MVNSESSKRVNFSNGGIDRISNLPEALISHILSSLPTKCAVSTSILSTRWKFRWTSVSNLDFCSHEHDWRKKLESKEKLKLKRDKFTLFVNRVLLLPNPPLVHNFSLKCYQDCFDPLYINSWIFIGFGRAVREFELYLMLEKPFKLPLLHCNVTVLKLDGDIHFNILAAGYACYPSVQSLHLSRITFAIDNNSSIGFPNLKIMNLSDVEFADEDSVHKLLSSSPVLDDLVIERVDWDDKIFCLIICIPSLTRLSIFFDGFTLFHTFKLQIDSPALQYLNMDVDFPCVYLPARKLSSVLEANVNIRFCDEDEEDVVYRDSIIRFIKRLHKVKFLSVSGGVLKAFELASANLSPRFHRLTKLEIKVYSCFDFSVMIDNFLESMDNLEHLVLEGRKNCCWDQPEWTEPLIVPKCLVSRVTTISFSHMMVDCRFQLGLLSYLLQNAKVLQLLTIGTNHISEKEQLELAKKISLIPRGSQTCQVAFT